MHLQTKKKYNYSDIYFEAIDLMCGAGGATSGMEDAKDTEKKKICKVIACINHNPVAIKSHQANNPDIQHFTEDIIGFDVTRFPAWTPGVARMLFAGIECTNHSIAKGGQSRDADSRTMAEHLEPYIQYLDLDYLIIENVKEFRIWGPLHEKVVWEKNGKKVTLKDPLPKATELAFYKQKMDEGYKLYCPLDTIKEKKDMKNRKKKRKVIGVGPVWVPVHSKKGIDYMKWKKMVESYGYYSQEKIINAADYGARTIRKRLFIIFAKNGLPIEWPKPTHNKNGTHGLRKWLPVKPLLDLHDEGFSIFDRKNNMAIKKQHRKDLEPSSFERVYNGALKHTVGATEEQFINKAMGNQMDGTKSRGKSINDPSLSITTHVRYDLVTAVKNDHFLMKWIGDRIEDIKDYCHKSVDEPAPTVVCQNRLGLVKACREPEHEHQGDLFEENFIMAYHGNGDNTKSVNEPAHAIPAADVTAKVKADKFVVKNFSGKPEHKNSSLDEPIGAVTTIDHNSLVTSKSFIALEYSSGGQSQSVDDPSAAVLQNPKQKLVNAFMVDANYKGHSRKLDEPAATLLACRKHHYLVNPQYDSKGSDVEDPCFTIIARMDKKPPYLVSVETGEPYIVIYEDDLDIVKKLKVLMATYGIVDFKMRMLKVNELLKIQDFRANTKLYGNQTEQKEQIGNAVIRRVARRITESVHKGYVKYIKAKRKAA
jgi:DNA (cytosine-5)-methyltransferase 1